MKSREREREREPRLLFIAKLNSCYNLKLGNTTVKWYREFDVFTLRYAIRVS